MHLEFQLPGTSNNGAIIIFIELCFVRKVGTLIRKRIFPMWIAIQI